MWLLGGGGAKALVFILFLYTMSEDLLPFGFHLV
jgi:hypothetical protein